MSKLPPSLTGPGVRKMLPKRPADSHKGQNGHALILAGSRGMSGAAALAARGALRIGAGLVTSAIVSSEHTVVTEHLPEVLTLSLPETSEGTLAESALPVLKAYLPKRKVNVLAIGPGLSVNPIVAGLIKTLIKEWKGPRVLDADGLNNLTLDDLKDNGPLIITPHPGELAKLLDAPTAVINKDRVGSAERAAREGRLICVLKGHQTVITDGRTTRLNPTGNPAMATGGMGDILTGAIAGLLAQGLKSWEAACAGVYLHGLAGNLARRSDRGLLASDVADTLPLALRKIGIK